MKLRHILFLTLGLSIVACGAKEDDKEEVASVIATLTSSNHTETSGAKKLEITENPIEFTKAESCTISKENGIVAFEFKNENNLIYGKITGYSSSVSSYACLYNDETNAFTGCAIYAELPVEGGTYAFTTANLSKYSSSSDLDLTYEGKCSINLTSVETNLKGTVSCKKVTQVKNQAGKNNPQTNSSHIDLELKEFSCELVNI